jgi:hypothetical protein
MGLLMNNELGIMWKLDVMDQLEYYTDICLNILKKSKEKIEK